MYDEDDMYDYDVARDEHMAEWEHDGDLPYILDHLVECARGWDPNARLIGNARAEDIVRGITRLQRKVEWYERRLTILQRAQRQMRDPERKMVCDILANGSTTETGVEE